MDMFTDPQYEVLRKLRSNAMTAWSDLGISNPKTSNSLWEIYMGLDNLISESLGLTNVSHPNPMTSPRDES